MNELNSRTNIKLTKYSNTIISKSPSPLFTARSRLFNKWIEYTANRVTQIILRLYPKKANTRLLHRRAYKSIDDEVTVIELCRVSNKVGRNERPARFSLDATLWTASPALQNRENPLCNLLYPRVSTLRWRTDRDFSHGHFGGIASNPRCETLAEVGELRNYDSRNLSDRRGTAGWHSWIFISIGSEWCYRDEG